MDGQVTQVLAEWRAGDPHTPFLVMELVDGIPHRAWGLAEREVVTAIERLIPPPSS